MDDAEHSERTCRVCYGCESEDKTAKWKRPCRCRGTVEWIHTNCLQLSIEADKQKAADVSPKCGLCQWEYVFAPSHANGFLAILRTAHDAAYFIAIPVCLAGTVVGLQFFWTARNSTSALKLLTVDNPLHAYFFTDHLAKLLDITLFFPVPVCRFLGVLFHVLGVWTMQTWLGKSNSAIFVMRMPVSLRHLGWVPMALMLGGVMLHRAEKLLAALILRLSGRFDSIKQMRPSFVVPLPTAFHDYVSSLRLQNDELPVLVSSIVLPAAAVKVGQMLFWRCAWTSQKRACTAAIGMLSVSVCLGVYYKTQVIIAEEEHMSASNVLNTV